METKEMLVQMTTDIWLLVRIRYYGLNTDTFRNYKVYRMGPLQAYEYSLSKLMLEEEARENFFRKWWSKPVYYDEVGPYDEYGRIIE